MAEEVRTLIDNSLMYGVLSTNSDAYPGKYAYFSILTIAVLLKLTTYNATITTILISI